MENTTRTPCSQQRTHEIQDTIFREHVPFSFFIRGRKFYACIFFIRGRKFYAWMTLRLITKINKKVLKIRFLEYGNAGTPAVPYSYIYIYIYIYILVIVVIQRG